MGRFRRIICPGLTYHVTQRGNNRETVFWEQEDFRHYLNCLQRYKKKYLFKLFAFCLMPNHVHLLLKTSETASISKIIQSLTVAHIRYYNKKYRRCGHVWQGRFHSPLISDDEYLLNVLRYIEQNPVQAGMVKKPGDYAWSSYKLNIRKDDSTLIDRKDNIVWMELGSGLEERVKRYKELLEFRLGQKTVEEIKSSSHCGTPYVSDEFKDKISKILPLKRKRGRPRKNKT